MAMDLGFLFFLLFIFLGGPHSTVGLAVTLLQVSATAVVIIDPGIVSCLSSSVNLS